MKEEDDDLRLTKRGEYVVLTIIGLLILLVAYIEGTGI